MKFEVGDKLIDKSETGKVYEVIDGNDDLSKYLQEQHHDIELLFIKEINGDKTFCSKESLIQCIKSGHYKHILSDKHF